MTKMLELNKIYCGDCLELMREIPDKSIDLVLTDPPYSSGGLRENSRTLRKTMVRSVDATDWFDSDSLSTNGFTWLMRKAAIEWKRVLKSGGHALIFIDWRMVSTLSGAIESADLLSHGMLVWNKTYFGMGSCFRNQYELILHFSKGKMSEPLRRDVGNVLSFPPIRGGDHPTEKPVELLKELISVVCPDGGIVFDAFAGSGSVLVAAKDSSRQYLGIEINPEYCQLAQSRLEKVNNHKITDFFGVQE